MCRLGSSRPWLLKCCFHEPLDLALDVLGRDRRNRGQVGPTARVSTPALGAGSRR